MTEPFISRGFRGRRQPASIAGRLPPGQYETPDFPVLSAGPTPHAPLATWDFTLGGPNGSTARWSWSEFEALPHESIKTDIHCVTKWSKLDTLWEGVSVERCLRKPRSAALSRHPTCSQSATAAIPPICRSPT